MIDVSLGEYVELQRGTTYKHELLGHQGPVLLGLSSILRDGGFRGDSLMTYGGECPEKLILHPGDLYVSLKDVTQSGDLLGAVSRVPSHINEGRLTQDTVKLTFKNSEIPHSYIYWLLRTPQYRAYCRARATGTTNLSLSRHDFLSFPVPEFNAMRTIIVNALESLEGRISLYATINTNLENVAMTVFKSWFVDFDPVRAKVEGKKPFGMDDETAALFPDSREDTELGEIPRGWQVTELSNHASISKDAIHPHETPEELFCYYSIPAFDAGRMPVMEKGSSIKSTKLIVPDGSILLSKLNPRIPRVWRPIPTDHLRSICSTEFLPIIPRNGLAREYLYSLITHRGFAMDLESLATGTSGSHQRARPSDILHLKVISPPYPLMSKYSSVVLPFRRRMDLGQLMNTTIAKTRDALLPGLLTGKTRTPAGYAKQRDPSKECAL